MAKALTLDSTKCRGCFSCAIACSSWNFNIGDINISRIKVAPFFDEAFFVPIACFQCEIPYCAQVCPTNALVTNPEAGVVELDKQKCIGCKLCVMACPFGNIAFVHDYPSKCDLCGGDPICVKACQWGALEFVEVEQMSDSRRVLAVEKIHKSQKEFLQTLEIPGYEPEPGASFGVNR